MRSGIVCRLTSIISISNIFVPGTPLWSCFQKKLKPRPNFNCFLCGQGIPGCVFTTTSWHTGNTAAHWGNSRTTSKPAPPTLENFVQSKLDGRCSLQHPRWKTQKYVGATQDQPQPTLLPALRAYLKLTHTVVLQQSLRACRRPCACWDKPCLCTLRVQYGWKCVVRCCTEFQRHRFQSLFSCRVWYSEDRSDDPTVSPMTVLSVVLKSIHPAGYTDSTVVAPWIAGREINRISWSIAVDSEATVVEKREKVSGLENRSSPKPLFVEVISYSSCDTVVI